MKVRWATISRVRASGGDGGECRDGVEFARRKVGFEPDAKQEVLLRTEDRRVLLNCSRQWGKTSVGALRAAWEMVRRRDSCVVVVLSSGEDLAAEFVWKVEWYLRAAGEEVLRDARRRIGRRLRNGSRIVGMAPGEARARGMTATMLVLDEAAWIPDSIYEAVLPMVSSTGGSVWLLSTPGGKRGFFWEEWMRGDDWLRVKAPATEVRADSVGFCRRNAAEAGRGPCAVGVPVRVRGKRRPAVRPGRSRSVDGDGCGGVSGELRGCIAGNESS